MKIIFWYILGLVLCLGFTTWIILSFLDLTAYMYVGSDFPWGTLTYTVIMFLLTIFSLKGIRQRINNERQKNTSAADAYRKRLDDAFKSQIGNGNKIL